MSITKFTKSILHKLPAETAHDVAIRALKTGIVPKMNVQADAKLKTNFMGIDLPHPVGLAAGFDKNAECIPALEKLGFAFIEVGTATPKPQAGNPKPRIFRLTNDKAIINRLGFNNKGLEGFSKNLRKRQQVVVGANIGKNKDTANAIDDYKIMLQGVYGKSDYITVNISSPNTKGLRDLQQQEQIDSFLSAINYERQQLKQQHNKAVPIALKIAPDLTQEQLEIICDSVLKNQIDGLIISNTTISRPNSLQDDQKQEQGGLSGQPLSQLSCNMLINAKKYVGNKVDILSVGGIFNAKDVQKRLDLGAKAVQIYTSFIYEGLEVVQNIVQDLNKNY